jgi:hypothetical protein
MEKQRCRSPYCITDEQGLKGRLFTPPPGAQGIGIEWCPACIAIGTQVKFFSGETAKMIRNKWREYEDTELPKEVKTFMRVFVSELCAELGEEL